MFIIENNLIFIKNIYCNAHARHKFKESETFFKAENKLFIWCYKKVYHLEKRKKIKNRRSWQKVYFRAMERMFMRIKNCYSNKSSLVKAINYFNNNYIELTYFLKHEDILLIITGV